VQDNSNRKTAIIVGVLFLTALGTSILGSAGFVGPIINTPDYLADVYPNRTQVMTGMLLELTCAVAVVGIAVLLFPIINKYNKSIALGYLGLRIIESVLICASAISLLSLLTLSQEYVKAAAPDTSSFHTSGILASAGYYWAFQIVILVCGVAGVMLCYLLYQSRLVPRSVSVLGIIGYPLSLVPPLLDMFGHSAGMIAFLPGSLFEIILPIWLIVKGFNLSVTTSESAQIDSNETR